MITESSATGEGDTSLVIIEHQKEIEYPHSRTETSAQMDKTSGTPDEFGISHWSLEEERIREKEDAEENKRKESVPMKLSSGLPIVVADCAETAFTALSESTDYTEIGEDAISYVESTTAVQSQTSPAEDIPEAAIDLLSQEFKPILTSPRQPAADNCSRVEEELVTATVFAPLFGQQGSIPTGPEEPVEATLIPSKDKKVTTKEIQEAMEALSKEFEPESVARDITEVYTSERVEESVRQPKITMLAAIPETTEEQDTEERVEAVLKTTAKERCNLSTCEEAAPDIISKGEADEKAENESTTGSTLDSQSADTEALLVRLQSACTSVVEASAYRLAGLEISSLGRSITIGIHVAPKAE